MSTTIIARFQPRPGSADNVEQILRGMIAPTRSEPGSTVGVPNTGCAAAGD